MASSSSSGTVKYDVFPSFSGEDVRKSFLSHLLQALKRKSIISFIDNGIERSHLIADELLLAIRQSRISIVLLSKKYASSTWCLNELGEIHKCHEESGQMVIPIFYDVDPSHVRKQTGEFGKAFQTTCEGKSKDDIKRWKNALAQVASIAGYDSQNWSAEAEAIEVISKDVLNKLFTPSDDFRDFVGIHAHIQTLNSMLCFEYGEARMVGIVGPSGIGKSTIARALYSRLSSQFDHRAFVSYKRTTKDRKVADFGMKLSWAKHFLSEILGQKDIKIESLSAVEQRLKHRKVLIVLDDVDEIELLETLVGRTGWFGFGSRIIVVTQDKALLESHGIDLIYEVEFPSEDLALQMFCQSAFGKTSPTDGFMELATEVANLSGNLPLGLNVLGSSLRRKEKEHWVEMMPRLRNGLNGKIEKTLRVCYDELDEKDDQDIFLHIACLFNRESVSSIKNLLEKSFYTSVKTRVRTLADKSLIRITAPLETVEMHILLQKLGREIVRAESIYSPGKRRFLVDAKDISHVFNDNIRTGNVLGICLHTPEINEPFFIDEKSFEGMCNLQFIKFYKEKWAQRTGEVRLYLPQGLIYLPHKLRLLHWDEYPAKYIPSSFNEYLVEFRMEDSMLEKLWDGALPLRCLKKMNIAGSEYLKEIPDLSNAPNLEVIDFSGCTSLVTLPCSIRNLKKLWELWMFGCSNLEVLPTDINLESLNSLSLRKCSRLQTFPLLSKNISCLLLDGTAMEEEDCFWIENLSRLTVLDWENCPLRCMPSKFHPEHLTELIMSGSNLEKLWEGVQSLRNLTIMALSGCKNLKEIPDLSNATNLEELDLSGCKSLKEIPDLSKAINLELLNLSGCSQLTSFPQLSTSVKLIHLDDTAIEEVPSWIENIAGLTNLWMHGCRKLRKISATIWNLKNLQCVDFTDCGGITSLSDASLVKTVAELHADDHMDSNTEFLFRNCFSLDRDAQEFILQSDFKNAVLPGKQVPMYFTHRTCGTSLTVPSPQSSLSQKNLRFTACIVPEPMTASLSPKIIIVKWKFMGVTGTCDIDPVSDFCEMDHMVVFRFGFCRPQEEVNDPPSPLDCDNVEFEFELHSTYLCNCYDILGTKVPDTCPSLPCKIKGCGVRVLNVPPSLDANDSSSELEYTGQSGESDVETERSKKRMRMTVITSQEHCNPPGGQTPTPNLDLSSVLDVDMKEEALCVDPMITEQQDTETPIVDPSFSSQLLNFFSLWK